MTFLHLVLEPLHRQALPLRSAPPSRIVGDRRFPRVLRAAAFAPLRSPATLRDSTAQNTPHSRRPQYQPDLCQPGKPLA